MTNLQKLELAMIFVGGRLERSSASASWHAAYLSLGE